MKTLRTCIAVALFTSLALNNCSLLSAAFYLTGAQIYKADANGRSNDSYRYTTNSEDIRDTGAFRLGITGLNPPATRLDQAISFELITGLNTFEFDSSPLQSATLGSNYIGLNLFFSDTNTSYNPVNNLGNSFAGHITAVVEIDRTDGFFKIVQASTQIQNYDFRSNGKASANGSSSFSLSDNLVTLTSLSASAGTGGDRPSGSFGLTVTKLEVTATPEPATLGLGGLACVSLLGVARRKLRRKTK